MRPLYVETTVRCGMPELWRLTQDPEQHEQWDLRFTHITYLPAAVGEPTRFRYATKVLPGLTIEGVGVTVGERVRQDGTCTSALRFGTDHPLSVITTGSGYWRYVPVAGGIRFLTGYDYKPRYASADLLFRPLLGWATAWSFDRLRLWIERGITPRRALRNALFDLLSRVAVVALTAAVGPLWTAALTALAVIVLPPSATTPAARRCLRRPPDRLARKAPSTLDSLELS